MAIGSRYYQPVVDEFARHGWLAQALPRRGFETGDRPAARGNDWNYRDEIDDIATALARVRAEHPGRPVIVLAHSLGGQLAVGHEINRVPADGLATIGACLPDHRDYPARGVHIVILAGVLIPLSTAIFGYLPKPAFGAPGARTLMREWARMAITGRPPYPLPHKVRTPSLVMELEGDRLAPAAAVRHYAQYLFEPDIVTTWRYRKADVPAGASNHHVQWVRSPAPVVVRVIAWWSEQSSQFTA